MLRKFDRRLDNVDFILISLFSILQLKCADGTENENLSCISHDLPCIALKLKRAQLAEMGDHARSSKWAEKWSGCCAPFRGGAGSPCDTMSHEPRPTSVPSGILIHPVVGQNTPTLQTGQTARRRSDSTRSTFLQNGRPKTT